MPDDLLELARRLLAGQALLEEFAEECGQVQGQLQQRRDDFVAEFSERPDAELLSSEISAVLNSFDVCFQWLEVCEEYPSDFDSERLSHTLDTAATVFARLEFDFFRIQRATWSVRGPVSHAGINRILESDQDLELVISEELSYQAAQAEQWQAQGAWECRCLEWSEQFAQLLRGPRGPNWLEDVQGLGEQYQGLDLEGLARRYASGPTAYAWINLTIHSVFLLGQAALEASLVEHIFESAQAQVMATMESAREASALENQAKTAQEVTTDLLDWLQQGVQLQKNFKQEVYAAWSEDGIQLAEELHSLA